MWVLFVSRVLRASPGPTRSTLTSVRSASTPLPTGLATCRWSTLNSGWTLCFSKTKYLSCGRNTKTWKGREIRSSFVACFRKTSAPNDGPQEDVPQEMSRCGLRGLHLGRGTIIRQTLVDCSGLGLFNDKKKEGPNNSPISKTTDLGRALE